MPVRVASIPADHVYVHRLAHPDVVRLPDPPVPGAPAGVWWPPRMLEPSWVHAHAELVDIAHLHFGFDDRAPTDLSAWLGALRTAGRPVVLTVHDLRNPHHHDPAAHDAALDVLVPAVDAVLTLTPGAAAEIARRWGRTALVVGHPHVVSLTRAAMPRPPRDGVGGVIVVGVHGKPARANDDTAAVARALVAAVAMLDAPELRVRIDVRDDADGRATVADLADLAGAGARVAVRALPRLDDDALWDHLAGLDVAVLPYRFGTHSGWAEACHDLGTAVLVPDVGYYAEQGPFTTYRRTPDGPDVGSLAAALARVCTTLPGPRADVTERRAQRERAAAQHHELYRRLLDAR